MAKFADPDYQQKLPPILMQRWPEIVEFQKYCHTVTLKVLTLFASVLNVFRLKDIELICSCLMITLQTNIRPSTTQ